MSIITSQWRQSDLLREVNNTSTVKCMRVLSKVKPAPIIPICEVSTYNMLAKYFGVSEKRLRNIYVSHRELFLGNVEFASSAKLSPYAITKEYKGKHYGYVYTFLNGAKSEVSASCNALFNARGILILSIFLKGESAVSKAINDTFKNLSVGDLNKSGFAYPITYAESYMKYINDLKSQISSMENAFKEIQKISAIPSFI